MSDGKAGPASTLLHRFWALFQARRWAEAQTLLAPEAHCQWWATRECFDGAGAVVHVNAVYPEGWQIFLLELTELPDGRVLSLLRVDHGGGSHYANSYARVEGGRIQSLDEYWSDTQPPPAWRCDPAQPLPGRREMPFDTRTGLPLTLD